MHSRNIACIDGHDSGTFFFAWYNVWLSQAVVDLKSKIEYRSCGFEIKNWKSKFNLLIYKKSIDKLMKMWYNIISPQKANSKLKGDEQNETQKFSFQNQSTKFHFRLSDCIGRSGIRNRWLYLSSKCAVSIAVGLSEHEIGVWNGESNRLKSWIQYWCTGGQRSRWLYVSDCNRSISKIDFRKSKNLFSSQ